MFGRILFALAALAPIAACGPEAGGELVESGLPIINGVPDTEPAHAAVVAVYFHHTFWSFCSGTLIGPNHVLTAAHCAYGRSKSFFEILFGQNAQAAERRRVTEVWIHPDYDPNRLGRADICLMRFEGSAPAGVAPIPPLPARLALTKADQGEVLQFVGYGLTEARTFTNKLTVRSPMTYVCEEPASCNGLGFATAPHTVCYDSREVGGPCSGDSGGPAFLFREGQEYVVGVTSYGDSACARYGCSVKVDAFADTIDAFLDASLDRGESCSDDLACMSGHCADGVCCDEACQGLCEACNLAGSAGTCSQAQDGSEPGCKVPDEGCAQAGPAGSGLACLVLLALLWRRR